MNRAGRGSRSFWAIRGIEIHKSAHLTSEWCTFINMIYFLKHTCYPACLSCPQAPLCVCLFQWICDTEAAVQTGHLSCVWFRYGSLLILCCCTLIKSYSTSVSECETRLHSLHSSRLDQLWDSPNRPALALKYFNEPSRISWNLEVENGSSATACEICKMHFSCF